MMKQQIREIPKVELHCHLDGSLSKEVIEKYAGETLSSRDLTIEGRCENLKEYLEKFRLPLLALQSEEGLKEAGYDFIRSVSQEHVKYVEVRFAPMFSVNEQRDAEKVIESVLEGLEKGSREYGTAFQVMICAMRGFPFEENLKTLRAARTFLGEGVCAADLAGNEAAFPMREYLDFFAEAKKMGLPFVLHAGECGSVENIIDSVQCGARRIGHGIAMKGNKEVQKLCRDKHVGIEMCPTSNYQTGAVSGLDAYPLQEYLENGLLVTVNTDNRTVSGCTLTDELLLLMEHGQLRETEISRLMRNAAEVSFAPDEVKHHLLQIL